MRQFIGIGLLLFSGLLYGQDSTLAEYFPLKLFFANDEPNPRTNSAETNTTYTDNYMSYKTQFSNYQNEGPYFDFLRKGDIVPNYQKLMAIKSKLIDSLNHGNRVVLTVKGFASPLHNTDYNVNISRRRIESFQNELMQDKELNQFIKSDQLILQKLPFGEYTAHESINDNLDSTHLSVYHMQSSYERRVEIDLTKVQPLNDPFLHSDKSYFDAGSVKQNDVIKTNFTLTNLGVKDLEIEKIVVSCGCSSANSTNNNIQAKSTSNLSVEVDTKELHKGKQSKSITVVYNNGKQKRFTVLLEVI